ncbi:hypothetical protein BDY21DRAFT_75818 [Lineolata rhizophorae]|uniref:BTB domain-containing protein n=1 Tax=Lineolata rhizophorae TaxID=578093 RepID=A0A6A6NUM2_9PEZI|nr:hypothetical protein BDY21DRAFT_75818 [Lineolata rhizophorae]
MPPEDTPMRSASADSREEDSESAESDAATELLHVFDAEGDITLFVGRDKVHEFRMCSSWLASASETWADMVDSAMATDSQSIQLPDDDPLALKLMLQIVHFQFSRLTKFITLQELYSIAMLSQKYRVRELFKPFVENWIRQLARERLDADQTEWILISYEFGASDIFLQWMDHLARNAEKDEDGCVIYRGRKLAELFPGDQLAMKTEEITHLRTSFLRSLIEICQKGLTGSHCLAKGSPYKEQCDALKSGYLFNGLKDIEQWPFDPSTIRMSPYELKNTLLGFHSRHLPLELVASDDGCLEGRSAAAGDEDYLEDHSECGVAGWKHEVAALQLANLGGQAPEDNVFTSPMMLQLGFYPRDFDNIDSGSEADDSYSNYTFDEPEEEFVENNFEEDYDRNGTEGAKARKESGGNAK